MENDTFRYTNSIIKRLSASTYFLDFNATITVQKINVSNVNSVPQKVYA